MLRALVDVYRDAFSGLRPQTWWLAAVLFVNRAGTMVLPFLSLYLTEHLGLPVSQAGLLVACFGVGSILGSLLGGWLSDRMDPLLVQRGSLLGTGLVFLAILPWRDPWILGAVMFASGLVADTFRPALMVSVARASRPENRARAFALARLAGNAGMAIGPAIGGWLATLSYPLLFAADALTCWAAALLLFWKLRTLPPPRHDDDPVHDRARRLPLGDAHFVVFLVAVLLVALAFFQVFTLMPIHLRDHYAMRESTIGSVIGLNALLIVIFEMILLRRIEGATPLRVAAVGALLVGAGLAMIPLGPPLWIVLAATAVWTVGEMLTLPMTTVIVSQRANTASQGSYMGLYMLTFSLGMVLAPIAGTRLYERVAPAAVWIGAGVSGALAAVVLFALAPRMRLRAEASTEGAAGELPEPESGERER